MKFHELIPMSEAKESKIPAWVKNVFSWYSQDKISEDEVINAIKFLVQNGIIQLESSDAPIVNKSPQTKTTVPPTQSSNDIITNADFAKVQSDPEKFVNKWAKLTGEVSQDPIVYEGQGSMAIFHYGQGESFDITKRVWLSYQANFDLKEGDCLLAEGKIEGKAEAVTILTGASREIPVIGLEKTTEISCLDAKYPAFKSIKLNESQTLGNIKVTVDSIELSKYHTRVFLQVENIGNPKGISFYDHNSVILQDKNQFKKDYVFGSDVDNIEPDIPNGIIEKGIIFFEPIEANPFKLVMEGNEWLDGPYGGSYKDYLFEFNISTENQPSINTEPTFSECAIHVVGNNRVTLTGSSEGKSGYVYSYSWKQIEGPKVQLSSIKAQNPYFSSPAVTGDNTIRLSFELTVTDNHSGISKDNICLVVGLGEKPKNDLEFLINDDFYKIKSEPAKYNWKWVRFDGKGFDFSEKSRTCFSFILSSSGYKEYDKGIAACIDSVVPTTLRKQCIRIDGILDTSDEYDLVVWVKDIQEISCSLVIVPPLN